MAVSVPTSVVTFCKLVCSIVLIFIAIASLCLVPAKHGPYFVVYGPKAPFRAFRASLQLIQAVTAIVTVPRAQPDQAV